MRKIYRKKRQVNYIVLVWWVLRDVITEVTVFASFLTNSYYRKKKINFSYICSIDHVQFTKTDASTCKMLNDALQKTS